MAEKKMNPEEDETFLGSPDIPFYPLLFYPSWFRLQAGLGISVKSGSKRPLSVPSGRRVVLTKGEGSPAQSAALGSPGTPSPRRLPYLRRFPLPVGTEFLPSFRFLWNKRAARSVFITGPPRSFRFEV